MPEPIRENVAMNIFAVMLTVEFVVALGLRGWGGRQLQCFRKGRWMMPVFSEMGNNQYLV